MRYLGVSSSGGGNLDYEITLVLYRDTNGIPILSPPMGVKVFDLQTHTPLSVVINMKKVAPETLLKFGDSCFMPKNLTFEEYVYRDTIELSIYSNDGYYVAWETCCRNAGIINIDNPLSAGTTYKSEILVLSILTALLIVLEIEILLK